MQPIKLEELDLKSLKALFYDFMVEKEMIEKNISLVNQEISLRVKGEMELKKPEENHTQELVTN